MNDLYQQLEGMKKKEVKGEAVYTELSEAFIEDLLERATPWIYNTALSDVKPLLHKAYELGREESLRGNDAYSFRGNELHIFARSVIDKVVITRNGERFDINIPKSPTPTPPEK